MSTNLELIRIYFKNLEERNFFGTVEVTLQGGKMAYCREMQSIQDFEVIADHWDEFSEEVQAEFKRKFCKNEKFMALLKKKGKLK